MVRRQMLVAAIVAGMGMMAGGADWSLGRKVKMPPTGTEAAGPAANATAVGGGTGGVIAVSGEAEGTARAVKRLHIVLDDSAKEKEFLSLVAARQRGREDLTVVSRLFVEKRGEVERFTREIRENFGIRPDRSYRYDSKAKTIFELTPKVPTGTNAPTIDVSDLKGVDEHFNKKEHRRMKDDAEASKFLQLVASKQLSAEEQRVLQLLAKEKQIEIALIQGQLGKNFSISTDRNYQYDTKTRSLYEIVPVPLSGDKPSGKGTREGK